jgi:hypothetical protein
MTLNTILRSSLAVVTLATAVACADSATPTAPRSVPSPLASGHGRDGPHAEVATCKLQKEEWKTERIGTNGGKVDVDGISLEVPRGALSSTVSITAHVLPTTSASVQFSPEGLQFAKPATLTMSYSKCQTPFVGVTVVYVQADTVAEVMPSHDQPIRRFVVAKINHFSSYAVAY